MPHNNVLTPIKFFSEVESLFPLWADPEILVYYSEFCIIIILKRYEGDVLRMLCQRCKKNKGTISYSEIIDGREVGYILCQTCYSEMFGSINTALNNDILAGLFSSSARVKKRIVCPACGMRYSEFELTGLLGCASCYDYFKDELMPYIEKIQGKVEHVGKVGENDIEQELNRKLRMLQEKLENAVREGRYGDAEKINKKISEVREQIDTKEDGRDG